MVCKIACMGLLELSGMSLHRQCVTKSIASLLIFQMPRERNPTVPENQLILDKLAWVPTIDVAAGGL